MEFTSTHISYMKPFALMAALLIQAATALAQTDPTIMTINGKLVSRSEFEYSYNKNNSETVVDKKSVADYVDLFINYKLKVLAIPPRVSATSFKATATSKYVPPSSHSRCRTVRHGASMTKHAHASTRWVAWCMPHTSWWACDRKLPPNSKKKHD